MNEVLESVKTYNGVNRVTQSTSVYERKETLEIKNTKDGVQVYIGPQRGEWLTLGGAFLLITKEEALHVASVLTAAAQ